MSLFITTVIQCYKCALKISVQKLFVEWIEYINRTFLWAVILFFKKWDDIEQRSQQFVHTEQSEQGQYISNSFIKKFKYLIFPDMNYI